MNEELEKAIKKYNRIYVIELFVIAAVVIVLATLKLLGIIGSSDTFRHIFNIITLVGSIWIVSDFIWLCLSKKRQQRNDWFDKASLLPFALALIVFDIYCLINWNNEISFFSMFVAIAFYYIAAVYIAQGFYHLKKPSPAMRQAAIEEYYEKQKRAELEKQTQAKKEEKPNEDNKDETSAS